MAQVVYMLINHFVITNLVTYYMGDDKYCFMVENVGSMGASIRYIWMK